MLGLMKSAIRGTARLAGYDIRPAPSGIGYTIARRRRWGDDYISDLKAIARLAGRPIQTIFVVGAFEGHGSLELLRAFPHATVHSFEPDPETFGRLVQNVRPFPNAVNHNIAVGDASGHVPFYVNAAKDCSSLLPPDPLGILKPSAATTEITVVTLDDFCREQHLGRVDYVHADVQGVEHQLLRGACRLLEQRRIATLLLEVSFDPFYQGQSTVSELFERMSAHDYRFVCTQGMFFEPGVPYPRGGNLIFTAKL